MSALEYAGLVGKYVRMEREVEGESSPIGMECVVAMVHDLPEGGVEIVSDDGLSFTALPGEVWRFRIWASERMAARFDPSVREAIRRRRAWVEAKPS